MRKITNKAELLELHREQVKLRKEYGICGIGHIVEVDYAFMLKLEANTIEMKANPRLNSSPGNVKNLAEMRQRGVSIIDNPKGAMLLVKLNDTYVIPDGLHTFRSTEELARIQGRTVGNYVVRVQCLTIPEYEYFKLFGDNIKGRTTAQNATLMDSAGKEIAQGGLKTKQCQIADKLNSFSLGKYGGDRKTAADRTMHFHEVYRTEIEYVTSFSALMALKKSRENNSAVLSVFCDAIKRLGQPAKDFFRQFAALTYADEENKHPHATRLLNWVKDQKIGARAGTENVVKGTSYWIAAYVLGWPTHRKNGDKISTDVSRYFINDAVKALEEDEVKVPRESKLKQAV